MPPWGSSETRGLDRQRAAGRSLKASRAPKIAAFTSRMSCAVSMMIRSAPPSTRPRACSAKTSTSLREGDVAEGRVVARRAGSPVGPIEPATKRSRPAALRAISAALVLISSVCSPSPHSSSFSRDALEGVGLDHLGARLEHRGVDALDHVGAVEDERLVALALEAAVVLLGELELLQGRAHAAVEDDDTLAHGPQEVARSGMAEEGRHSR